MATIKAVDTMVEVQRPGINTNVLGVPDVSKEISNIGDVVRQFFKPDEVDPALVLDSANKYIDSSMEQYKKGELNSAQFEDSVRNNTIKLLVDNKVPIENWGNVTSQIYGRADNLTKNYKIEVDGKHIVVDSFNNATVLYDPKRSVDEQDLEAIETGFGIYGKAIVRSISKIEDPEKRKKAIKNRIDALADLGGRDFALQKKNIDYKGFEIDQAYTKEEAQTKINETLSLLSTGVDEFLSDAKDNPEVAFSNFKQVMLANFDSLSDIKELSARGGINYGEVKSKYISQINEYKDVFEAQSTAKKDSLEYERLKVETHLRKLRMTNSLNDADFFTLMQPQGMMALIQAQMSKSMLPNDVAYLLGIERTAQRQTKEVERAINKNRVDDMITDVEEALDQYSTDENSDIEYYKVQQFYNYLIENPDLVGEEYFDKMDLIKRKWSFTMTRPKWRKIMTMNKKASE